jgi:hypothetical protein
MAPGWPSGPPSHLLHAAAMQMAYQAEIAELRARVAELEQRLAIAEDQLGVAAAPARAVGASPAQTGPSPPKVILQTKASPSVPPQHTAAAEMLVASQTIVRFQLQELSAKVLLLFYSNSSCSFSSLKVAPPL